MDDTIVNSSKEGQHNEHLVSMFIRVRQYNIMVLYDVEVISSSIYDDKNSSIGS